MKTRTFGRFFRNLPALALGAILLASVASGWGQTTLFSDNFGTSTGAAYDTSGAIGSSADWSLTRSGADFGARIDSGILDLSNDAGATTNVNGWVFGYRDINALSGWNTTLSSNSGTITWEFNMRQIRSDPAGLGAGSYGVAFVLAGTSATAATLGSGYAVVLGQSGTTDAIRLVSFNNGLQGTLTDIITSNTAGLTDFGAEYLSVRVTYIPSSNTWQLFVRNDGSSAFTDPTSGSALTSQGTAVNTTYTATTGMRFIGGYWSGSTAGNQTAFFDNVYLKVTPAAVVPTVTTPTATSIATTSATLGANVTADGGATITSRGTVLGTSASPTGNSLAEGGTTTGVFTHSRTGLTANTAYFYRGYAVNSAGTGYSADGTFTTLPLPPTVGTGSGATISGFNANWTHPTMGSANYTYTVEVDNDSNFGSIDATFSGISSSSTSQAITGLNAETTYYFRVRSVNATGSSENSSASAGIATLAASTPTLNAVTLSSALSSVYGAAATGVSFTASGSNLSGTITATAQSGYEVSSDDLTYSSSVSIASGSTVYVRFAATLAAGTYNGATAVVLSSTGVTDANVTTSGSGNTVDKRGLSIIGISIADKEYDRSTTATITGTAVYSGLVNGDSFPVAGTPTAAFSDRNVATGKSVTVTGYTAPSANYTITQPTALTASITAKALTLTSPAVTTKTYDGNTSATIGGTLSGIIVGDTVTLVGSGTFASASAGIGIGVTSTSTLGGADGGNYTLTQPTGLVGSINAKALTITGASALGRIYDGTTTIAINGGSLTTGAGAGQVLSGDSVTLGGSPTGSVSTAAVGNGKIVTVTGYSISGTDSGNYSLTQPTGLTVNITNATPPTLTASANANVDGAFDVTFADDALWRGNISSITVSGTTLTAGFAVSAGKITFTPSASNPTNLLRVAGTKAIVVNANNYTATASILQTINPGAATKLAVTTQPAAPTTNGGALATQPAVTVRDQYDNTVTGSSATVSATVGAGTWTLGGTTLANASSGVATFSGFTATSAAAVTGATITFSSTGLTGATSSTFNIPAPAPANDLSSNPTTITVNGGAVSGTTLGATISSPFTTNSTAYSDVWFRFTAPATGTVTIATTTTASSRQDLDLFAWSGSAPSTNSGGDIGGASSGDTTTQTGTISATSGTTYFIRVLQYSAATAGAFTITATMPVSAPATSAATAITSSSFTANWASVAGATSYRADVMTSYVAPTTTDLIISEYVEGTSNNRYLEIYNGTGSSVSLSNYEVRLFSNGNATANSTQKLDSLAGGPSTLAPGATLVLRGASSTLTLPAGVTSYSSAVVGFNGNDAVALFKISANSYVDIFGRIGSDPGTAWTSGSFTTLEKTLRRKISVTGGVTSNPASTFTTLSTEWDQFDVDTVSGLGSVEVSRTYLAGFQDVDAGSNTNLSVTGLSSATTYYYAVRAVSGATTSPDSDVRSVTTKGTSTISVTGATSFTYNGSAQGPATANVTGSQGAVTYSYSGTGGTSYGPSATAPTNAGTYSVTATAASDANFDGATSAATAFNISKATPTITADPTASAITIGQTLASSMLSGGTANVEGIFAFTTSSTSPGLGTASQGVTFTPSDVANYNTASTTVSVTVNPASLPTVTFTPPASPTYDGTAKTYLASATGPSSLVLTYTGRGSTTYSNTAAPINVGDYTVTATSGDSNYTGSQAEDFSIAPLAVIGSFTASNKTYDATTAAAVTGRSLTGVVESDDASLDGGTANFDDANAGTGKTVTLTGATLSGAAAGNYTLGSVSTTTANIDKAAPSITAAPTASNIDAGQALSSSTLSGGSASVPGDFAWTFPGTVVSATGNYSVTFTPTDAANYNTASALVNVTVNLNGYNAWAGTNGLTGSNALGLADPDGDGFINNAEYAFGTRPTVADGSLVTNVATNGVFRTSWNGPASGVTYGVQVSTNLSTMAFSNDPTVTIESSGGVMSFTNQATGNKFFRVRATSN